MHNSYKLQDEELPKNSYGYCNEASTYNEDRQCWCNRHNSEVSESHGICDGFDHI